MQIETRSEIVSFPASPCLSTSLEQGEFMSVLCSSEFVQVVSFPTQMLPPQECQLGLRKHIVYSSSHGERALAFLPLVPVTPSQGYMWFRASDGVAVEVPQAAERSCRHRFTRGFRNLLSFPRPWCSRGSAHIPCVVLWFLSACLGNRNWASTVTVQGGGELKGAK